MRKGERPEKHERSMTPLRVLLAAADEDGLVIALLLELTPHFRTDARFHSLLGFAYVKSGESSGQG